MKYFLSTLALLFLSNVAWADAGLLKIGGGVKAHTTTPSIESSLKSDTDTLTTTADFESTIYGSVFAQLQHGLPFVPNMRITNYSLSATQKDSSNNLSVQATTAELFYTFGFAVIETQIGATYNNVTLDNDIEKMDYNGYGLAGNLIIDIPAVPITPSVNFDVGIGDDDKVDSVGVNIAYNLFVGLYLDIGIKNYTYTYTLDDTATTEDNSLEVKATNNTAYLGVSFNLGL